jgi:hypothetical protein
MEWFGFWIFASTLVVCDTWLFSRGYNSFLHTWKTPEEKALRKKLLDQDGNSNRDQT